jgi:hypothetical protein
MDKVINSEMAAYVRKLRKYSGSILTFTLIGALLCFAMAHLFLLATDEEDDLDRRRRDQVTAIFPQFGGSVSQSCLCTNL